jgi:hypothetical protein
MRISVISNIFGSWSNDNGANPLSASFKKIVLNPSGEMVNTIHLKCIGYGLEGSSPSLDIKFILWSNSGDIV